MMNKRLGKRIATLTLTAALMGGVAGGAFYGVNAALSASDTSTPVLTTTSSTATAVSTSTTTGSSTELTIEEIAESGLSSVVCITNVSVSEVQAYFGQYGHSGGGMFGNAYGGQSQQTQTTESTSVGSGVIIYEDDDSLYIVTNYHVIEDATTLSITFVDDETYEAEVCGYDEDRDIAVVKVSKTDVSSDTLSSISIASIGSSDELSVGETVVAIGNALGYGQSVTSGIVSAVDREISTDEGESNSYIQTDAAINSGNSGGALFNMNGELIGINTAKISSTGVEGMGYAIPISEVLDMIEGFITES